MIRIGSVCMISHMLNKHDVICVAGVGMFINLTGYCVKRYDLQREYKIFKIRSKLASRNRLSISAHIGPVCRDESKRD